MARKYTKKFINGDIIQLLKQLIDVHTDSENYAKAMYELGTYFGNILLAMVTDMQNIGIVCTVEDADYLARGIIDVLEKNGIQVFLNVFWNKRFKPFPENGITIAPIIMEFHESEYKKADVLVVVKSIISSSCVVRTNLTRIIEDMRPQKIFVVAPVLLDGAIKNLESEFDNKISSLFNYIFFAKDTEKNNDGIVLPGIGGDVYQRLGFGNQDNKNKYMPKIVSERRDRPTQKSEKYDRESYRDLEKLLDNFLHQ